MPITKSAQKALRQNKTRNAKNVAAKKALKLTIKKYQKLVTENAKEAAAFLPSLYQRIDKSVGDKIIKKNKAARLKSRLTKKIAVKK